VGFFFILLTSRAEEGLPPHPFPFPFLSFGLRGFPPPDIVWDGFLPPEIGRRATTTAFFLAPLWPLRKILEIPSRPTPSKAKSGDLFFDLIIKVSSERQSPFCKYGARTPTRRGLGHEISPPLSSSPFSCILALRPPVFHDSSDRWSPLPPEASLCGTPETWAKYDNALSISDLPPNSRSRRLYESPLPPSPLLAPYR